MSPLVLHRERHRESGLDMKTENLFRNLVDVTFTEESFYFGGFPLGGGFTFLNPITITPFFSILNARSSSSSFVVNSGF